MINISHCDIAVSALQARDCAAYAPAVPSVGKNLKTIRLALGLNQDTVADRCGVAQGMVSLWETGKQEPTVESLLKLAAGLGRPIEEFVTGVNREFDLACQKRDQQSLLSMEGAPANVPAAARVELRRLADLVDRYKKEARQVLKISDALDKTAIALEEIGKVDAGAASRRGGARKTG